MTQAVVYNEVGGPEVLELVEIPAPQAEPGKVVIRVEAIGVNPVDGKLRSGVRPGGSFPRRTGADGAGIVTAVGEGVEGFRVGDTVVFGIGLGAYASEVSAPQTAVSLRPGDVSAAQGAALPIPAGTAYQVLRSLGVRGDDVLLIHGGSGSVGQAMIQFARLMGARVIATCSERRAETVAALGAIPVRYGEGLDERVRALGLGEVTVAVDCAGTEEAIEVSKALIADHSRIATIVNGARAAEWGIRAFSGGSPHPLTARENAWRAEAVPLALALIAAGAFRVELGPVLPLSEAAEAQRLCSAGADGKIVLVP